MFAVVLISSVDEFTKFAAMRMAARAVGIDSSERAATDDMPT
jgi:hypothetical protein